MARPLIQLALDSLDNATTFKLATLAAPYVDVLEIGTPNIKANGLTLVRELKRKFPNKLLLVDLKTMDAGEYEASPSTKPALTSAPYWAFLVFRPLLASSRLPTSTTLKFRLT